MPNYSSAQARNSLFFKSIRKFNALPIGVVNQSKIVGFRRSYATHVFKFHLLSFVKSSFVSIPIYVDFFMVDCVSLFVFSIIVSPASDDDNDVFCFLFNCLIII